MPDMVLGDELLDAQVRRAIMAEAVGAADRDECLSIARRIGRGGLDRWHDEWRWAAEQAIADGERLLGASDRDGARRAFLRASTMFRTAGVMLYAAPADARLVRANRDQTDAFRRGAALLPTPPRIVEIPYESLRPFTLRDKAASIRCPMFINNAQDDDIGATAPELVAALTVPHRFVTFTRADGGGDHCEVSNRKLYLDTLFAWLDDQLSVGRASG